MEPPLIAATGDDVRLAATRFVRPFNALGVPALSIPLYTSSLSVGLQIVGRPFNDADLLAIAYKSGTEGTAFSPHTP